MHNERQDDIPFAQLLEQGDEKAFSIVYDSLWEPLFGYVQRVLQDKEEAMDIVQETFISVWQQRRALSSITPVRSYIFSIARYKAFRYIRLNIQKRDYLPSLIQFLSRHEESPEAWLITEEFQQIVDAEVKNLPPKMREVFVLSREENLSHKEIAERLNISDKTVKKQISNSMKILRLKLDRGFQTLFFFLFLEAVLNFISC